MSFNSHCVAMLKPPESLCAKDEGVTLRKRIGQAGFEPATSLPPRVSAGWSGHAAIAPPPLAPSVATSGPEPGLNPGPKWNSFSGPESGTRKEQLFGARIGARIKQLFGARIRDPKGTAFRGPNRGPNQTTFRGPNPGPERNSFSGPESGPESVSLATWSWPASRSVASIGRPSSGRGGGRQAGSLGESRHMSRSPPATGRVAMGPPLGSGLLVLQRESVFFPRCPHTERHPGQADLRGMPQPFGLSGGSLAPWGSLEATVLHICVHQPSFRGSIYDFLGPESGTRMEQLFGARIGARIEQLFGARGSWLWMFLQGLFGCHCFNLHICVHQPSFRSPNGIRLFGARIRDPNPGLEWNSFSGPNPGPESNDFSARNSWLWIMFFQGLFGGHRFNLHICVHQPSFRGSNGIRLFGARIRDPNGTAFRGPNRGPNRTTFRGPGLLAVDVPPGALSICTFVFTSHLFGARME